MFREQGGEMTLRWVLGLAAAALLAMLFSGCGDDDANDSADVSGVVTSYLIALSDSDGTAACELLTDEARAPLDDPADPEGTGRLLQADGPITSCEDALSAYGDLMPAKSKADLVAAGEDLGVKDSVEIDGDTATLTLFSGDAEQTTPLELVDGDWRISDTSQILFGPLPQETPLPQAEQPPTP
jgi:hypothetical protein